MPGWLFNQHSPRFRSPQPPSAAQNTHTLQPFSEAVARCSRHAAQHAAAESFK